KMADLNAPSGQTPAMAPPLHADDQILPHIREKEGHSNYDSKHSLHQADYPSSSKEAQASYYREYLAKVAQHKRYLAGETGGVQDPPAPKPTQPARKPKTTAPKAPSRPSVSIPEKKRKQAAETSDKPPKEKKSKHGWSDNEEESEKVVLRAEEGGQDEGQAGPDPDTQVEDQTGSDTGAQAEDQTGSDAGAQAEGQAGSNLDETSKGQAGSNPDETSEG
nr:hypothetical protein [Tanacetum cinerariifolium]